MSDSKQQQHVDDWDAHWADYGESAQRNPAQSMRRRVIIKHLRSLRPTRIVDIGSGQGDLAAELVTAIDGVELLGLELGASGVAQARQKVPKGTFVQTNLLMPQAPADDLLGWGEAATCSEVLEHIDDPALLLRNASVYLRPGASVVVTVPAGPRSEFDLFIGHRRHFTSTSLRSTLEAAGLQVESISALGFPFFNLYRMMVIARGEQLVDDARNGSIAKPGLAIRVLFRFFDVAFRMNIPSSRLGWQLVAVARVPGG